MSETLVDEYDYVRFEKTGFLNLTFSWSPWSVDFLGGRRCSWALACIWRGCPLQIHASAQTHSELIFDFNKICHMVYVQDCEGQCVITV